MKRYFSFNISGKDIFPLYLQCLGLVAIPIAVFTFCMVSLQTRGVPGLPLILIAFASLIFLFVASIIIYILWGRKLICAVGLGDNRFKFEGSSSDFVGLNIMGILLSIITLGIYTPWYITKITKYMIGEISYKEKYFDFRGSGFDLFLIILFTSIIPSIIVGVILAIIFNVSLTDPESAQNPFFRSSNQLLSNLILIPYYYLAYKWFVDIEHSNKTITWETEFGPSVGKILIEVFLMFITLGLYYPVAMLKLYRYFLPQTVVRRSGVYTGNFGFEGEMFKGFWFIWLQIILSIITLGFYIPWAMAKVYSWILSNTYYETVESEVQPEPEPEPQS